jgi:hypothetical protein
MAEIYNGNNSSSLYRQLRKMATFVYFKTIMLLNFLHPPLMFVHFKFKFYSQNIFNPLSHRKINVHEGLIDHLLIYIRQGRR